jgi:hypothetical protein
MHSPGDASPGAFTSQTTTTPVGAAEGCDLLIFKTTSKDRSLRQLLHGIKPGHQAHSEIVENKFPSLSKRDI